MDRASRIQRGILYLLQLSLVLAAVLAAFEARWTVLFASLLVFVSTFAPLLFERRYNVDLPVEFELVIVVFLYGSLFLGEVHGYYTRFWWWDALLHTGSGVALGFVGFLILYVLDKRGEIRASPAWIAVFAFCFAVAIGAVWEIFEFGMDQFFGLNMQRSGLIDTMGDLIVDSVGALFTSILGYFYLRTRRGTLVRRLVERFEAHNPRM